MKISELLIVKRKETPRDRHERGDGPVLAYKPQFKSKVTAALKDAGFTPVDSWDDLMDSKKAKDYWMAVQMGNVEVAFRTNSAMKAAKAAINKIVSAKEED